MECWLCLTLEHWRGLSSGFYLAGRLDGLQLEAAYEEIHHIWLACRGLKE